MAHELIGGLAHVCVSAADEAAFDKAVDFYTEVFGFALGRRWRNGSGRRRVMLETGSGAIELNEDGTSQTDGIINHFCLACADVDAFVEYARGVGCTVVTEPMTVGGNEQPPQSIREAMLVGPCGELIQLQQANYRA